MIRTHPDLCLKFLEYLDIVVMVHISLQYQDPHRPHTAYKNTKFQKNKQEEKKNSASRKIKQTVGTLTLK